MTRAKGMVLAAMAGLIGAAGVQLGARRTPMSPEARASLLRELDSAAAEPTAEPTAEPSAPAAARVIVNGEPLDDLTLRVFERRYGMGVRPGDYWYDRETGAWGMRGGPTQGIIAAGLTIGGPLRADASGGGAGDLTGVYINGRELHPADVAALTQIVRQPIVRGRYWVDANGVGGVEGGPAYFNLAALARQASGGRPRCLYCGSYGSVGGDGDFLYFSDSEGRSATSSR